MCFNRHTQKTFFFKTNFFSDKCKEYCVASTVLWDVATRDTSGGNYSTTQERGEDIRC